MVDVGEEKGTIKGEEKELINNYHNDVFRELAPYMDGDDLNMLKKYTKTIV